MTCWPTSRARSTTTPSSGDDDPLRGSPDDVRLAVWAVPGGRRSEIVGVASGRLRVRLSAPAREGRANRELCRFLAEVIGLPQSAVAVTAGLGGRHKTVSLSGVRAEVVRRALGLDRSPT